jgi:hypothetical protein
MERALARHDAQVREAPRAAVALQRALVSETWQTGEPLRARIALHTGTAEERDGDHFDQTAAVSRASVAPALVPAGEYAVAPAADQYLHLPDELNLPGMTPDAQNPAGILWSCSLFRTTLPRMRKAGPAP